MPVATMAELVDNLARHTRLTRGTAERWASLCEQAGLTPDLAQQACVFALTSDLPIGDVLQRIRR